MKNIKLLLKSILSFVQILLLNTSYFLCRFFLNTSVANKWVICGSNIGYNIIHLSNVLPNSTTICFSIDYNATQYKFDYEQISFLKRIFYSPVLLGYMCVKNSHFFYVYSLGFMLNRDYEFAFLKKKLKKIVCLYVGDDIRSPVLMSQICKELKLDHFVSYMPKPYGDISYDNEKRILANITDKYTDLIFNFEIDQISYIKSKQYPFVYFCQENLFINSGNKFQQSKIKILHAPSNNIVKGTPLVRAAIKRLQMLGYEFEYIELSNVARKNVLEHLKDTHIVLNQFYGFLPGLFGIEAMASRCAVLMSSDPEIEISLPKDSKDAWMVTKYWQISDNLEYLLKNPEAIQYYADNGFNFVKNNYQYESASRYVKTILMENGLI